MRSLVIIPTYNEAENIAPLVDSLLALGLGLHVLIVDDNSPDGTGQIADEVAAAHRPFVWVLHRAGKLGLGTAYTAGFELALERGYERIVTMDADFSHNPRYVPSLIDLTRTCDLGIGSRYVPGGGVRLWGLHRRLLSRGANFFARAALGLQARDCTAGFRCYQAEVLRAVDPASIRADGYSYLVEMLWRVQRAGFRVGETPIVFTDRRRGASKISRQEIFKAGSTVLRLVVTNPNETPAAKKARPHLPL
ncbi:MAG: polyprenol monophosphomannose synthase [Caldilineales bacterium]|nr:polyprenol monophosphomannose synthase [Caldilineales bacterium]MCW5859821.1 polyprenol monophosphomannose synthase [Caldilineales bacterium]